MDKQYQISESAQLPIEWFEENKEIKIQEGIPSILLKDDKEGKFTAELVCPICTCILWKPVSCSSCQKSFCDGCMTNSLAYNYKCPTCRQMFTKGKPHHLFNSLLSKLNFFCPFKNKLGCYATVPYDQFESHLNNCPQKQSQRFDVKSIEILDYSIQKDSFFSKQYINYQIKITHNNDESYIIYKRYNDFVFLHHELFSDKDLQGKIIPQLPQKCYDIFSLVGYSPSNKEDILERKVNLEIYLRILCSDPVFFDKQQLKNFLEQDSNQKNDDEKNIQEKVQEFIKYMQKLIDFKDFSLTQLQRKFLNLWANDVKLNSNSLDENEKLSKEYITIIDAIFHYLIKNLHLCQETISSISDQQSKQEKQEDQQNEQSQHKSTIDQILEQFKSIIQHELSHINNTQQKLIEMIHSIAYFRLKINGFLDALNKIKQITTDYNYCVEQKMSCNDEQQRQEYNKKINVYQKTLEIQQKNLEIDSNQLKEEISKEIPNYLNEFLKEHQNLLISNPEIYMKIQQKYQNSNDHLFYKIQGMLSYGNN